MLQMSERQQLKIFVRPSAKADVERVCERYGMTQQEMCSRVYEWFADQEEVVQATVLGLLPRGHEADIASAILDHAAQKQSLRVAAKPMVGPKSTPARPPKGSPMKGPKP